VVRASGYEPCSRQGQDISALKGRCSFRLGTTSYILPQDIEPNVRFLTPLVDEVELVWFEGRPESLPSSRTLDFLAAHAREHGLRYNVHLPLDLFLGDREPAERGRALDVARRCVDLALPLDPTCLVLHLENRPDKDRSAFGPDPAWCEMMDDSLGALVKATGDASLWAVENTDYPPEWSAPMVQARDMRYCLDMGHLARDGQSLEEAWQKFGEKTIMLHCYGLTPRRRHGSLRLAPGRQLQVLADILKNYDYGLSLEVFDRSALKESVECLATLI
jgi:sugar phosphate isomerase/epimerase